MTLICVSSPMSLTFNSPCDLFLTPPFFFFSGVIRVSLADMDRETRENYTVVIQAKDMGGQLGGLAGTTTVNITLSDVNDNPPMFDQSKQHPSFLNPHKPSLIPPDVLQSWQRRKHRLSATPTPAMTPWSSNGCRKLFSYFLSVVGKYSSTVSICALKAKEIQFTLNITQRKQQTLALVKLEFLIFVLSRQMKLSLLC